MPMVDTYTPVRRRASNRRPPAPGETECADSVFQQPWWLDAVAPGHWAEVTCERDGRTVARLPFVIRGRPQLRMLTQSTMTQTLGPWVERSTAEPSLAREHEPKPTRHR